MKLTWTAQVGKPTLGFHWKNPVGWGSIYVKGQNEYLDEPRFKYRVYMRLPDCGFKYRVLVQEHDYQDKEGQIHYTKLAEGYADTLWGARRVAKRMCRKRMRRFADG